MFKITIATLAATATLAASGVALADNDVSDRKIMSGTFCQNEHQQAGYWRGRVVNKSNEPAYIDCPIVRDIAITGGGITQAQVKVIDQSPTDSVRCALWSQDGHDISGWGHVSSRSTSVPGYGDAVLGLAFDPLDAIGGFGYYSMDCTLPAAYAGEHSTVLAYMITER